MPLEPPATATRAAILTFPSAGPAARIFSCAALAESMTATPPVAQALPVERDLVADARVPSA
jgi:hypothetical protein